MHRSFRSAFCLILLVLTFLVGGCTGQRMESANGKVEDLNGPVAPTPQATRVARKAVVALTPAQEKALQNELMSLPEGLLDFDTPPALRHNTPVRLEARLSREFVVKLNEAIGKQGLLRGFQTREIMGLGLKADGMTVKSLTPTEQKVGDTPTTTWAWEVNPSSTGRHALTLTLTLHFQDPTGNRQRAYPVVERFVDVQDAQGGFLATYGWWILAILLVGAAVVLLVKKP